MPITKSAKKAIRQSARRRTRNLSRAGEMKDAVKEIKKLNASGKKEEAKKMLPRVFKALDKAAKTGVIKKEAADRKKSRISKLVNKK